MDGGKSLQLRSDAETVFLDESGVRVTGDIGTPSDEWGPDARLKLNVGSREFDIVQHTEGRGENSNAMLDLSVSGLGNLVEPVGGWLGVDGAHLAGGAPIECRKGTDDSHLSALQRTASLPGVYSQ